MGGELHHVGEARMDIFAYVYGRGAAHVDVWQPILKLEMLATLIHEIAHVVSQQSVLGTALRALRVVSMQLELGWVS